MISKWTWPTSIEGQRLRLPTPDQVYEGDMLELLNFSPGIDHGLSLRNGKLISSKHVFTQVAEEDKYTYAVTDNLKQTVQEFTEDFTEVFHYVRNVSEFLEWAKHCRTRSGSATPLFRGHSHSHFKLETTFSRFMLPQSRSIKAFAYIGLSEEEERERFAKDFYNHQLQHLENFLIPMLRDFIAFSPEPNNHFDPVEWLVYARHSELPLPVLDFSRNPLISLYFALGFKPPRPELGTDATVFAAYVSDTGTGHLYEGTTKGHGGGDTIPYLVDLKGEGRSTGTLADQISALKFGAIASPSSISSARLQNSVLLNIPMRDLKRFYDYDLALSHCFIKDSDRKGMIQELALLGINETSIYGDSKALAKSIEQQYALRNVFFGNPM